MHVNVKTPYEFLEHVGEYNARACEEEVGGADSEPIMSHVQPLDMMYF